MRRNTVTIFKYMIIAAIFFIVSPMMLKAIFGNKDNDTGAIKMDHVARGLPEDPGAGAHRDIIRTTLPTVRPWKESSWPKFEVHVPDFKNDNAGENKVEDTLRKFGETKPVAGERIDWHDYQKMAEDKARTGPGEQGAGVILSVEEEQKKNDLYKVNGFNAFASDKISLDRALRDIRHPECKHKKYLADLPTASVIIPFHNEHWSTLLRLVHSILNRSPTKLIEEVILVDDYSNKPHCKKQLDDHVASNYDGKVKVVHAKKREGLIRTRLLGAKVAKGDVLIFLDSHCECNVNWLPPLLEPIALDRRTVVCPFVDVTDYETFAYRAQDEGARGAFDWEFFYKRLPLLPEDLKHPADPFKSPVMAGGLFAIERQWFWQLGGYDPGLDIWGGEQYELSFKIWQCGGMMVDAPCSRVAHVYRKFAPFPNPGVGDFVGRNYRRVAEVWMDEYKEHLFRRRPHYRNIDPGDLTAQFAIRKKLNCKPFSWFMKEVAFDLPKHYPPVEPPSVASGELRNVAADRCVDTRYKNQGERFQLEPCISDKRGTGGEQNLELTWHRDIRPRKRTVCFDVSQSIDKAPVILYNCHGMLGNQHFKYNPDTRVIYHKISNLCLDCDKERYDIFMSHCQPSKETQQWRWTNMNATAAMADYRAS